MQDGFAVLLQLDGGVAEEAHLVRGHLYAFASCLLVPCSCIDLLCQQKQTAACSQLLVGALLLVHIHCLHLHRLGVGSNRSGSLAFSVGGVEVDFFGAQGERALLGQALFFGLVVFRLVVHSLHLDFFRDDAHAAFSRQVGVLVGSLRIDSAYLHVLRAYVDAAVLYQSTVVSIRGDAYFLTAQSDACALIGTQVSVAVDRSDADVFRL